LLKGFTQHKTPREMQAMAQVAQMDRASFMYSNNDQMTSEVKDALSAFDLDKTGRVNTSELVAGAKALQEVRGQNSFLRKVLFIHALTMGLLLAGMFGLSMAAMELSKETKVGAEGALVSQQGDAVLVGSSDTQIVTGANGSPELRQRRSSDERRLGESDDDLVRVGLAELVVLDLDEGDDEIDGGNQTNQNRRLTWDPGRKYQVLTKLNYKKCATFMKDLKTSSWPDEYTLYVLGEEFGGRIFGRDRKFNQKICRFVTNLKGETTERVYVRCENKNRGRKPCSIYFKKTAGTPFLLDDGAALCWKKGVCDENVYAMPKAIRYDRDPQDEEIDWASEADQDALIADDSFISYAELGFEGVGLDSWLADGDEMHRAPLRKAAYRIDDTGRTPFDTDFKGCTDDNQGGALRDAEGEPCYEYFTREARCGQHDDDDFTASEACCACGGGLPTCFDGKHNGDETDTDCGGSCTPCEDDRRTWPGRLPGEPGDCNCYKQWATYDHIRCDDYCCNPDGAMHGDWCVVKSAECQGQTWQYCSSPSGA